MVSWRSRAIRLRSSPTASTASSSRAARSSRLVRPMALSANRVSEMVPTVTAIVTPVSRSPPPAGMANAEAIDANAMSESASRSFRTRAAVTPA